MEKLLLKNFEFHINPNTWNSAQDLVQAGAVRSLREVEKHFWVATVRDEAADATYEAEAIITPQKIKAFACECWAEGRRMMCPHVAATLLRVRQYLEKKTAERLARAEARAGQSQERFTVQTVLEDAAPEALREFVRDYARRDRDFGLALKTWFAGAFTDGAKNSYALVLDSVLPKTTGGSSAEAETRLVAWREPDFRRLRKALDSLDIQLENAEQQGNSAAVFQIAAVILEKIVPLLFASALPERKRSQLLPYCQTALQKLLSLKEEDLSPELREAIWQLVFRLAEQDKLPAELSRDALRFLADRAEEEGKFAQINGLFDRTHWPAPLPILQLFTAALARRGRPEAVARVLDDYAASRPDLVRQVLLELYYLGHWAAARHAGDHFLKKGIFNAGQRRELEEVLFFIAEKTGDRKAQIQHLRERFLQTGLFDFFDRLRTTAGPDAWQEELKQVLSALQDRGEVRQVAAVLAAENELSVLAGLLEKSGDLPLLQRYEHLFLPADKNFVRARYVDLLSAYLAEHFGRPASTYAREALSVLLAKDEADLVADIIRDLAPAFPDRSTLAEELAEVFPKTRRKSLIGKEG